MGFYSSGYPRGTLWPKPHYSSGLFATHLTPYEQKAEAAAVPLPPLHVLGDLSAWKTDGAGADPFPKARAGTCLPIPCRAMTGGGRVVCQERESLGRLIGESPECRSPCVRETWKIDQAVQVSSLGVWQGAKQPPRLIGAQSRGIHVRQIAACM